MTPRDWMHHLLRIEQIVISSIFFSCMLKTKKKAFFWKIGWKSVAKENFAAFACCPRI